MMPDKRAGLYPPFADKVDALLTKAMTAGLPPCEVFMGLRTWEEQDALYAKGRTVKNPDGVTPERPMGIIVTHAKGGESWHCMGLAVDIVFRPNGNWSWDYNKYPYIEMGKLGIELGLEWGGSWAPPKTDMPHFELRAGLIIQRAQALYREGGFKAVWDEVARRSNA